jgi:hypothetical protein
MCTTCKCEKLEIDRNHKKTQNTEFIAFYRTYSTFMIVDSRLSNCSENFHFGVDSGVLFWPRNYSAVLSSEP